MVVSLLASCTTIFVDTRLWKTKHPWKRFQNFRQSCVLLTDWSKSNLGFDWWIYFDPICQKHARLTEFLETFPLMFCLPKSRINENGGNIQTPSNIQRRQMRLRKKKCNLLFVKFYEPKKDNRIKTTVSVINKHSNLNKSYIDHNIYFI